MLLRKKFDIHKKLESLMKVVTVINEVLWTIFHYVQ
jgi:hypothetical protein